MALFKKLKESMNERFAQPESKLIGKGYPGQATVLSAMPGTLREPFGAPPERSTTFSLDVYVEGNDIYRVEITQVIPEAEYQQIAPGKVLRVWVDPEDANNLEFDFSPEEEWEAGEAEEGEAEEGEE